MWFLSGVKHGIWTSGGLRIYGCDGKGERQRRIPGDGEAEGTVTDAISSPPPSMGVTPVIMWIKWQKTGHARLLSARSAAAAARARVARLCPFLSFSIKMNNFQPYKLSQRSVKIPYGIKPYKA